MNDFDILLCHVSRRSIFDSAVHFCQICSGFMHVRETGHDDLGAFGMRGEGEGESMLT